MRRNFPYKEDVCSKDLTEVQEISNLYLTTKKIVEGKPNVRKARPDSTMKPNIIKAGAQLLQEEGKEKRKKHPKRDGKVYKVKCYNCRK